MNRTGKNTTGWARRLTALLVTACLVMAMALPVYAEVDLLVRAMSRIGYRFYNDGDQLGIGYGKETCNPAGRFLGVKGNDKIAKLTADAWAVYSEEAYEKVLDILCGAVADYVEQNPDLRNQPTEDMWDFKDEEEDQDDSWDEEEDDWDEEEDYEDDEDY